MLKAANQCMEQITHSSQETTQCGIAFAKTLKPGDLVALFGDLGSGKTTFLQGAMSGLGITQRVTSPTFIMAKMYIAPTKTPVFHIDLYRTESPDDLASIGLTDMINDPNAIIFVEWADKMKALLPQRAIRVTLTKTGENERIIHADRL